LTSPVTIDHRPKAGRTTYRAGTAPKNPVVCIVDRFSYCRVRLMWYGEKAILRIGRYTSIAPSVTVFIGGNHRTDWVTTYPIQLLAEFWPDIAVPTDSSTGKGDVDIGHDVWIGDNATIMSGISIGHGAVVGAGAIVAKDVAPYAIVAGNPAREIRRRFADGDIAQLLEIGWWDWPDARVRNSLPLLASGDLAGFFAAAAKGVEA